jgi:hypothetical protein
LEIHIDQSLESYLRLGTNISTYDDLFSAACEVFKNEDQNIMSVAYRNAIEKCFFQVEDEIEELGEEAAEDRLRIWLLREVLTPIETEVRNSFGRFISVDNLDEQAEALDLAPRDGRHKRRRSPEREGRSARDATVSPVDFLQEGEKASPLPASKRRRQGSTESYEATRFTNSRGILTSCQCTQAPTITADDESCGAEICINQSSAGTLLKRYTFCILTTGASSI